MEEKIKEGPKEFFLYFFNIITLWGIFIAVICIWFLCVDVLLYESEFALHDVEHFYWLIRVASAILITFFPAYFLVSFLLFREYQNFPEKKEGKWRKWMIYLTLFVGGLIILGNLVVLVYKFLEGEISKSFVIKSFLLFIFTGFVFWYYLQELHNKLNKAQIKIVALIALLFFIFTLFLIFYFFGTPLKLRSFKKDLEIARSLERICNWGIKDFWEKNHTLPSNLEEIASFYYGAGSEIKSVKYQKIKEHPPIFKLCAVFNLGKAGGYVGKKSEPLKVFEKLPSKGENCFILTISRESTVYGEEYKCTPTFSLD